MRPADLDVLVVDDDLFTRSLVRRMLHDLGVGMVREAGNGAAALHLIEQDRPHLILCDIRMAPMDGLDFVRMLRSHADPRLRALPVMLLTGDDQVETVLDAVQLDIQGYLLKPPRMQKLREMLMGFVGPGGLDPPAG